MTKKVALHGAYFVDNFGDSLFVVYFHKWIKETGVVKDKDIILPFANDRVRELVNVSSIKGIKGLLKSDKLVFFGGGYLGERPYRKHSWHLRLLVRHLSIGLLAFLQKKPFVFIGVGAGPLTNSITRKIVVFLCNRSEKILVRDEESYSYLLEYGVKPEKIMCTADSILLLKESDVDQHWNETYKNLFSEKSNTKVTYIGAHLQASSSEIDRLNLIVEDLEQYCQSLTDYKIVFFNDTYRKTPDHKVLKLLQEKFDEEKILNINYENPDQLIALINNLDVVITTKLHCGIVANCLGKYTLSISVHDKTKRLYKQLNLQERNVSLKDYKNGKLKEMLSNFDENIVHYNNVPEFLRELAAENKASLIKFINER